MWVWQYLKTTWMLFWRFWLINLIWGTQNLTGDGMNTILFFVSLGIASALMFGFKRSIGIFPIFRVLTGRNPLLDQRGSGGGGGFGFNIPGRGGSIPQTGTVLEKASQGGIQTGWEPRHLQSYPVPNRRIVRTMRGTPGSGLSSASHMTQSSIRTGQLGETNFAKALNIMASDGTLVNAGDAGAILQNVSSFWSVAMPSEESIFREDPKYNTDVDAVIVSGNTMFLVDLKFYKSGDVTYRTRGDMLHCIDNLTGNAVGQPRKMTANMRMAHERFIKHFPRMIIRPMVVFVPTDAGAPVLDNVQWPVGIPAVGMQEALVTIANTVRQGVPPAKEADKLVSLVKH